MPKDNSSQNRGRRDADDQTRDRNVYRYLLTLTELVKISSSQKPNETSIAKQWGVDRIFVRRMLRDTLDEIYSDSKASSSAAPSLTLAKLVSILSALMQYRRQQQANYVGGRPPMGLSPLHVLKALRLWFQLQPSEREKLELPAQPHEQLLNQIYDQITSDSYSHSSTRIIQLYDYFLKQSITQSGAYSGRSSDEQTFPSWSADEIISRMVTEHTKQYFSGLPKEERQDIEGVLFDKVTREINRIKIQSGIEHADTLLEMEQRAGVGLMDFTAESPVPQDNIAPAGSRLRRYLTPDFVQRLTQSLLENELITDEFPINIKYFEIKRIKPLPLYIKQENEKTGILNPLLLQSDQDLNNVKGLERQVAYRVRVHFYIKLPEDYNVQFDKSITRNVASQKRLEFYDEVVGVGSPISHITAVINRVLLWDLPILKDYVPIANSVHSSDVETTGLPNSPLWSHCVAKLYRYADLMRAIESEKDCEAVTSAIETANADFCGFDLIETTAKAALHARLKLIKQVIDHQPTVTAADYMRDLCCRVEERNALKFAQQYFDNYPFCLKAMEGYLESTIFSDQRYRTRQPGFKFKEKMPKGPWSIVAIDSHLKVAEAFLKEGLFRIAKTYLDAVKPHFDKALPGTIGDLLFAQYHLCWFRYYYLVDLKDEDCQFPDRYVAVRSAEKELIEAKACIERRLRRYDKLNELPQSNLHPQFYFLSRIHAHQAKLHIFFSNYMSERDPLESLLEPIKLLEKAKIYAARDGNPALYAQWSAYQSWCYVMLTYLSPEERRPEQGFSRLECLDWAKRLVNHANLCYAETGKACYQNIKNSSGRITQHVVMDESTSVASQSEEPEPTRTISREKYYEQFGNTWVQVTPLIQELTQSENARDNQGYLEHPPVVKLDFSLLKETGPDDSSSVYRFGMQSSILLFAEGILALCSHYDDDVSLISEIQAHAVRQFTYCAAIASDGTRRNQQAHQWSEGIPANSVVLDRAIPDPNSALQSGELQYPDSLIQCLYPHRLTQFADLGKIFIVVCELVLLIATHRKSIAAKTGLNVSDIQKRIQSIRCLLEELRTNDRFPFPSNEACGQRRYNGHLDEHYIQLEKFVDEAIQQIEAWSSREASLCNIREQLVTTAFRLIRGNVYMSDSPSDGSKKT